jgi:hypothetical protein
MLNRKRTIYILISLFLVISLFSTAIFAFLFDEQETESIVFTVGNVEFLWQGSLIDDDLVVPGQPLIETPFVLVNQSTITTELRLKIDVQSSLLGTIELEDMFMFILGEGWVLESDNYYYYRGDETDQTSSPGKYLIPIDIGAELIVLDSISLDGFKVKNPQSNQTVTLTFTFQAKQGDYVDWLTLGQGSYDFNIG